MYPSNHLIVSSHRLIGGRGATATVTVFFVIFTAFVLFCSRVVFHHLTGFFLLLLAYYVFSLSLSLMRTCAGSAVRERDSNRKGTCIFPNPLPSSMYVGTYWTPKNLLGLFWAGSCFTFCFSPVFFVFILLSSAVFRFPFFFVVFVDFGFCNIAILRA